MPSFELSIEPEVWEALMWEWDNGKENRDAGLDPDPNHPLTEFRYGETVVRHASIRLRGNPDHWEDLPGDKMQLQIGFNTYDESGRFQGLRRLAFDAATYNRHLLRDRLALAYMRDVGIRAPCANNAKIYVNGVYYGIFTSIEKLDESYLERTFEDPSGDLWQRQDWELKTNEGTATDARLRALRDADTPALIARHLELESALRVFAAEAILPNSDGAWAGGLNFFLYDDPRAGKFWLLPWDLDNTFERFDDDPDAPNPDGTPVYPVNPDPIVWKKPERYHGRPWFEIPLGDPTWRARYVELVGELVHAGYTPGEMLARIDTWSAQIQSAVYEDTNKPYTNALYDTRLGDLREYVQARHAFLEAWLACWQNGGSADESGYCVPAE